MTALIIILAYLLIGAMTGIIGNKLEYRVCPTRGDVVKMAFLAPIAVVYFLSEVFKKLFGSDWWDKKIC